WPDYDTLARNALLNPPRATSLEAFWSRPHGDLYLPVPYTMWWLAAQVALPPRGPGSPLPTLNPHVFHALNLVLHVGAACAVLMILRLLMRNRVAAVVGALLFALHPVQVESAAW